MLSPNIQHVKGYFTFWLFETQRLGFLKVTRSLSLSVYGL